MRLFLVSLAIAVLCLYPEIAELLDWERKSWLRFIGIPYTGLYYMKVFFHELGHTVTFWLFGQPAVPAFNFADGGGVAVPLMGRSMVLQGAVYVLFIAGAWWLFMHEAYGLIAALAAFAALHAFMAFGGRHELAVNYMGAGGAIIMGCYCMFRAAANWTYSTHSPLLERYMNMIFGVFAVAQNITMCLGLILNDFARQVYQQGIGGHLANDFTVIADRLDTRVQNVAWFSLGFITLSLAVTGYLYFLHWREHGFDARVKLG
jgi:hypothetical protein